MPQSPYASNAFDGFVTLSQLTASPLTIAEDDMLDFGHGNDGAKSPMPSWYSFESHPPQQTSTFNGTFSDMAQQTPDLPDLTSPLNNSSASNSPSPHESFFSVQQGQHQKRRAQNRAAQRAYRDRKMRHLVDLESGIRDIEDKIRRLQTENTGLIRELCEIRAENREWKEGRTRTNTNHRSKSGGTSSSSSKSNPTTKPASFKSTTHSDRQNEEDALSAPFEAMWNLICLDPAVANGDISAETVLERLRGRLDAQTNHGSGGQSLSSLFAIEKGSPGKEKSMNGK